VPAVFVNYRGPDSAWAVLLDRELTELFGPEKVFRAGRSIRPGDDFVDRILTAVRTSSVLLAVIGPDWVTATGHDGHRRLSDPQDWVRREIAAAFDAGIPVVPVRIGQATLPGAAELPADIARLARCQYLPLSEQSASGDIERIAQELVRLDPTIRRRRGSAAHPAVGGPDRWRRLGRPRQAALGATAAVAVVAAATLPAVRLLGWRTPARPVTVTGAAMPAGPASTPASRSASATAPPVRPPTPSTLEYRARIQSAASAVAPARMSVNGSCRLICAGPMPGFAVHRPSGAGVAR